MPPISLPVYDRRSLDNSILSSLSRCPRLAYYNYRLARASTGVNHSIQFGNAYHRFRDVLEKIYIEVCRNQEQELTEDKQEKFFKLAYNRALDGFEDPPLEHRKSYLDTTRFKKTCTEAFEEWLDRKRTGLYNVISTETPFELPLPSGRLFSGKIDQILEWNNRLWVRDFKTTSWGPKTKQETYNPDHQLTGYVWGAQELSGRRVDGVIIDTVYNLKTKGPVFKAILASRNPGDINHWLEWVEDKYDEYEERCESGVWPMQTSACSDYGGCFFRGACNSGDWNSIEGFLKTNTVESHWDPLHPEEEVGLPE